MPQPLTEPTPMPTASFRLIYDGDAVRDGQMDVMDLGPALLAVGQLAKAASAVVLGEKVEVSVKVRTVEPGSFDIWLNVALSAWDHVVDFLNGRHYLAAKELVGILAGAPLALGGVYALIRKLNGRRAEAKARKEGLVLIVIDGTEFWIPDATFKLLSDRPFREALEKVVVEPLEKDGFESVELRTDVDDGEKITKSERYMFRAPTMYVDDEFEAVQTKTFSIVTLSFKRDNMWKLADGHGAAKLVRILDEDFLSKVNQSAISFSKGDILICRTREISRITSHGLKSEYHVIKVIEHRKPGEQLPLL